MVNVQQQHTLFGSCIRSTMSLAPQISASASGKPQPGASASTSTFYEVSLSGSFFSKDLKPIMNRITLNSDSAQPLHTREVLFDPIRPTSSTTSSVFGMNTGGGEQQQVLRVKKDLLDLTGNTWEMYSFLAPESVRVHPEAMVRPWATCTVTGDALSFAAALGYVYVPCLRVVYVSDQSQSACTIFQARLRLSTRRVVHFNVSTRTSMFVSFPQCYLTNRQIDAVTSLPLPPPPETLWEVEVKTSSPVRNTQEKPLSSVIDDVLEVQLLMKGLLDLGRGDV